MFKLFVFMLLFIMSGNPNGAANDTPFTTETDTSTNTQTIQAAKIVQPIECLGSTIAVDTVFNTPKEVSFDQYILRPDSKRWRRLQGADYVYNTKDAACYNTAGQLVGHKFAISASAWERQTGEVATADKIKNMSVEVAKAIYKDRFWTGNNFHLFRVHHPLLMDAIFNGWSSSPANCLSNLKRCIRSFGFETSKSGLNPQDIEAFNTICSNIEDERMFFAHFLEGQAAFYEQQSKNTSFKGLRKWLKDYIVGWE